MRSVSWAIVAILMPLISLQTVAADPASPLAAVEADLQKAYPKVATISPDQLEQLVASEDPVVLVDARTHAEHGVSRLDGARRVDSSLSAARFMEMFGKDLKGKKVVVYCAVGGRSSALSDRIADAARDAGAEGTYSLQGGIFRWHNERRPLVGPSGRTDEVHPFSKDAEALIERKDGIAYTPGTSRLAQSD